MLDASHAIIGASLAKLIPNPYIGLPLSFFSHFLADLFPHWDFNTRGKWEKLSKLKLITISLTDAGIGFYLGYLFFSPHVPLWYLFSMMFIAQLPDWFEAPYYVFNWKFPPFSLIKKLQSKLHWKLDYPLGLITQIIAVLLILFLVLS